ncbi:MAG: hypothetical protein AB7R67_18770 [Vicinamibacterales bacterium]
MGWAARSPRPERDRLATSADVDRVLPRIVPLPWKVHTTRSDGTMFVREMPRASLILSAEWHRPRGGGEWQLWAHLSMAMPERLPSWAELVEVRDLFLGRDRVALQVLAPVSEHVNIHNFCLHLFSPIGDAAGLLPDFTRGSGTL